jgi:transposase
MISRALEAEILRLYHTERWPIGTIERQLSVHHGTVRRVLARAALPIADKILRPSITEPCPASIVQTAVPVARRAGRTSIVEPYLAFIVETLTKYPTLRASRLWAMARARGYPGPPDHFRAIVARLRPPPAAQSYLQQRTLPGEKAHVGWAHFGKLTEGGAVHSLMAFVMVLSYSHRLFLRFCRGAVMDYFIREHVEAFASLKGVPRVLFYKLKSGVMERSHDVIRYHPTLLELAAHYRFQPSPGAVAHGKEKGRFLDAVYFVREAFFAARAYRDLDDLNAQAMAWCEGACVDRLCPEDGNRTVRALFAEEQPRLLALPENPFVAYSAHGPAGFTSPPKKRSPGQREAAAEQRTHRVLEILHDRPGSFEINRASWSLTALAAAYTKKYGEHLSRESVSLHLKRVGFSIKKARRVLTSPDPEYREKVEQVLNALQTLKPGELFFFIDELGPLRVKKYGGRIIVLKGQVPTYPQVQTYKGSITMAGALSATTNQVTWIYGPRKDTSLMIDLVEILFNQHAGASRIFLTWDAASWHGSNMLIEWLDDFNADTERDGPGLVIQLVPLPTGDEMAAFLIDARFLLRNTTETFWGAPLIVVDGKDNTFCFGFMRDLLRLRNSLHIAAGAVVFGSDAPSAGAEKDICSVVDLCRELGVLVIEEPKLPALEIVATHVDRFSNIVTDDRRILFFCTEKRVVYLGRDQRSIERVTLDKVQRSLGVPVQHVPTYLALTAGAKHGHASINGAQPAVTTREARRLVELYGALPSIYQHLATVKSPALRKKLA